MLQVFYISAPQPCAADPCGYNGVCYSNVKPYLCYCTDDGIHPNDFDGKNCDKSKLIHIVHIFITSLTSHLFVLVFFLLSIVLCVKSTF